MASAADWQRYRDRVATFQSIWINDYEHDPGVWPVYLFTTATAETAHSPAQPTEPGAGSNTPDGSDPTGGTR